MVTIKIIFFYCVQPMCGEELKCLRALDLVWPVPLLHYIPGCDCNWASLPADKHIGSWELPVWRCLVVESEKLEKIRHLCFTVAMSFFFNLFWTEFSGKLALCRKKHDISKTQCCSPVAFLILILRRHLDLRMQACVSFFASKSQRHSHISPGSGSCRREGWRRPSLCILQSDRSTQTEKNRHTGKSNRLETLNQSLCATSLLGSTSCTTPLCVSSGSCNSNLFGTPSPLLESLRLHLKLKCDRPPACSALICQVSVLSLFCTVQKLSSCLGRQSNIPQSGPQPAWNLTGRSDVQVMFSSLFFLFFFF